MSEPTPRQVLYAFVAAGFLIVVAILILGAALAGVVPGWWTAAAGIVWLLLGVYSAIRWQATRAVLGLSILFFAVWIVVTLLISTA